MSTKITPGDPFAGSPSQTIIGGSGILRGRGGKATLRRDAIVDCMAKVSLCVGEEGAEVMTWWIITGDPGNGMVGREVVRINLSLSCWIEDISLRSPMLNASSANVPSEDRLDSAVVIEELELAIEVLERFLRKPRGLELESEVASLNFGDNTF